jgi:hypothetical protein
MSRKVGAQMTRDRRRGLGARLAAGDPDPSKRANRDISERVIFYGCD